MRGREQRGECGKARDQKKLDSWGEKSKQRDHPRSSKENQLGSYCSRGHGRENDPGELQEKRQNIGSDWIFK